MIRFSKKDKQKHDIALEFLNYMLAKTKKRSDGNIVKIVYILEDVDDCNIEFGYDDIFESLYFSVIDEDGKKKHFEFFGYSYKDFINYLLDKMIEK